jgi:hypothetical protein
MRETLIHGPLDAAGFLLVDCVKKKNAADGLKVVDAIMRGQDYYMPPSGFDQAKYSETLLNVAKQVGLSEDEYKACENDQDALKALNDRYETERAQYNVEGTPTFVINGKVVDAEHAGTLNDLSVVIDPLLKK